MQLSYKIHWSIWNVHVLSSTYLFRHLATSFSIFPETSTACVDYLKTCILIMSFIAHKWTTSLLQKLDLYPRGLGEGDGKGVGESHKPSGLDSYLTFSCIHALQTYCGLHFAPSPPPTPSHMKFVGTAQE